MRDNRVSNQHDADGWDGNGIMADLFADNNVIESNTISQTTTPASISSTLPVTRCWTISFTTTTTIPDLRMVKWGRS